ncbi:MAG: hypothetical protein JWM53_3652 [bacterium]|nr:hypothetical protein [bacterium]
MNAERRAATVAAAVLLGVGLGAFVDGIALHQLLQWHNMLSSRVPPTDLVSMKYNMVWDGLFHTFAWIATAVGVVLMVRAARRGDGDWSSTVVGGALLLGWGLFNLVEGTIDHELLGVHHVHPGAHQLAWDVGFLLLGAAQIVAGSALIARRRRATRPTSSAAATTPLHPTAA